MRRVRFRSYVRFVWEAKDLDFGGIRTSFCPTRKTSDTYSSAQQAQISGVLCMLASLGQNKSAIYTWWSFLKMSLLLDFITWWQAQHFGCLKLIFCGQRNRWKVSMKKCSKPRRRNTSSQTVQNHFLRHTWWNSNLRSRDPLLIVIPSPCFVLVGLLWLWCTAHLVNSQRSQCRNPCEFL